MKKLVPLNVTVILSGQSGGIKKCSCSCKASECNRCAHVTALLLFLDDFVKKNGHTITTPSTSSPCVWNQGKKKDKNPNPVHKASYSSCKRNMKDLYDFDPRPVKYRGNIDQKLVNNFVSVLQSYGSAHNMTPMWITQLEIKYKEFEVDYFDIYYYKSLVQILIHNINESLNIWEPNQQIFQIPGTNSQQNSPSWFSERQFRVTASICKTITQLGKNLDRHACYSWLRKYFWFKENITTFHMRYGIEEEPNAIKAYSNFLSADVSIKQSGLWVNKKYPYLGASPDGLIYDSQGDLLGIIETP